MHANLPKLPPVWLVKTLNRFRSFLLKLNKHLFPGNVVLYEQFQYFWLLPSLYVAAKLNVAEVLKDKPLAADDLARKVGADPDSIYRVMRALSSQGIFHERRDGRFQLNSISRGLLDTPGSMRYALLHHLGPVNWNLMSNLIYGVTTGKDSFANRYGMPIYDYLKQHPAEYALFDSSMTNLSDLGLAPVLKAYDFSASGMMVDLGGGEGFLLANILHHYPLTRGILFDLPEAVEAAQLIFKEYGVTERAEIRTGDFFSAIPGDGDLYILKNIIHNWNDEDCISVLENIRHSLKPHARILVIEMIIQNRNAPSLAPLLDIQMLACMNGGRERTPAEFSRLFDLAGFTITRIIPTIAPISLIEAQPKTQRVHG